MVDTHAIAQTLKRAFHIDGDYEIQSDGVVNVKGNISMDSPEGVYTHLPVQFGRVDGHFWAPHVGLRSWRGFPREVTGLLLVNYNHISSWQHAPVQVGSLGMMNNPVNTLVGMPQVLDTLDVTNCGLTDLKGLNAPLSGWLGASRNPLRSLEGYEGAQISFTFDYAPELHMLRALQTQNKIEVQGDHRAEQVSLILNKYVGSGKKGALACAAELIRAGFKGNARW